MRPYSPNSLWEEIEKAEAVHRSPPFKKTGEIYSEATNKSRFLQETIAKAKLKPNLVKKWIEGAHTLKFKVNFGMWGCSYLIGGLPYSPNYL